MIPTLLCTIQEELGKLFICEWDKRIFMYCNLLGEFDKLLLDAWYEDIVINRGVRLPGIMGVRLDVRSIVCLLCA